MKALLKISFTLLICIIVLIGCSDGSNKESGKVTLSLFSTVTNESDQQAIEHAAAKFEEANPDIQIDYNFPGGDYEDMLRVKMAANDMPDLFDTHGWAQQRYGEYVMDLSDMDWVADLDPALESIFTDDQGKVYAYPLNQAKDGLTYNKHVLDKYGIKPPETFDQFMDALEKIKEKSNGEVTPLWFAGSEKSQLGQFLDEFATPLLITHPEHNFSKELETGSFDWSKYTFLPKKLKEMQNKELLNEDVLTAQIHELPQLLAQDKIGFVMATTPIQSVKELNPDAELGVIPVPAIHEGGEQSWIGGERHTMAIWKDTEHPEAARKFIEFLAQPDIVKAIAEGTSLPAGLTNATADVYYSDDYQKYADVQVEPYFDRIYLPSGMWDVLGNTAQELLSGALTPEQVSESTGSEFERLRDQGK
ncbi:ABC transporter substrate-binding protein [Virgibacillus salexigens]|uniref:Multiple sugar-binding protein n=1 Tax=Virgibacillus massiliensis TaxID=1462526 RepID=A0A024QDP2_9BACI|nr:ABC transporter substrate-binding protein [Virgibacillus massiliensis]CDQ40614.1 Multiple sugar-binding protein precursor [Virgibacillus massiliensis]